eukprot:6543657-Pyramimonas_sp.AAC.1
MHVGTIMGSLVALLGAILKDGSAHQTLALLPRAGKASRAPTTLIDADSEGRGGPRTGKGAARFLFFSRQAPDCTCAPREGRDGASRALR